MAWSVNGNVATCCLVLKKYLVFESDSSFKVYLFSIKLPYFITQSITKTILFFVLAVYKKSTLTKMPLPPPTPPPQQQVHPVFKPSACSCGTYFGNPYRLCGTNGRTHRNIQPSVFTFPTYYGNPYRPNIFKVQDKSFTTVYGNPYAGRVLHVFSLKLNCRMCIVHLCQYIQFKALNFNFNTKYF